MAIYTPSLALRGALERIINPPVTWDNTKKGYVPKSYEHHVATWACTKLKEEFSSNIWTITPEQTDPNTNKKPDLIVEKAILVPAAQNSPERVRTKIHLCLELKKTGGDRMEKALVQLCEAIPETIDTKGNTPGDEGQFEVFAVVQCGLNIAFFEYHQDQSNLDEEDIPHFRGCVSLTEGYKLNGVYQCLMEQLPQGMKPLYHDYGRLKKEEDDLQKEAKKYTTLCVFHLETHKQEVHKLFQHMARNDPRSSM